MSETAPSLSDDWDAIAAHAAHHGIVAPAEALASWRALDVPQRVKWRASAGAVRMLLDAKTGSERVAGLVTEGNELRRQLSDLRDHIDTLALGLDMSARTSAPSKKSEIESGVASALRGLLRIDGESGEETRQRLDRERAEPAVTAGTGHLAAEITRLAIPDQEG